MVNPGRLPSCLLVCDRNRNRNKNRKGDQMRPNVHRIVASVIAMTLAGAGAAAWASSHREAPFITKNPKVDGTDFYLFRSYEPGRQDYVTVVANYQPLQDAYGGPNYFTLDPEAL